MKSKSRIRVKTRKDGLKYVKYTLNGQQRTIYAKTRLECINKYQEIKKDVVKPIRNTNTFLTWFEKWLQLYKSDLKEQSLTSLKQTFNKHILPKLANKPLKSINSIQIQQILNTLNDKTRTQTIMFIQLNACFQQAYKLNLISHNPCLACVIKKDKGKKGRAMTKDEQTKLLEYLKNNPAPINNLVLIYLNTGMRCSELLTINQADIDRENNTIHIHGTKTSNSDRILQTTPYVINLIPNIPKPFEEWNKDKVIYHFRKITKALNFKGIKIHSLRHTFATNCVESGVDMVVLQKWLGHASISMTIDRYTHISEEYKQQQINKIKPINI